MLHSTREIYIKVTELNIVFHSPFKIFIIINHFPMMLIIMCVCCCGLSTFPLESSEPRSCAHNVIMSV